MAGYSGTPLPRKLGVKGEHVVFLDGLPDGVDLGDLDGAQVVRRLPRRADVTISFHTTRRGLRARLPALVQRMTPAGMIWVCWPKRSAPAEHRLASDLDENVVRDLGLELGVVDVKVAAIDQTWSGLKLVRRLADR
jgi:hypothetical protein